jgi:hypothetical protein
MPIGQNAQRRYFPQSANSTPSSSTTNLLPPSATRGPGGGVQAAFAKGPPSLRTVGSNSSLVRESRALLFVVFVLILIAQNESPYNVSATAGSRIPPSIPSISDKASSTPRSPGHIFSTILSYNITSDTLLIHMLIYLGNNTFPGFLT